MIQVRARRCRARGPMRPFCGRSSHAWLTPPPPPLLPTTGPRVGAHLYVTASTPGEYEILLSSSSPSRYRATSERHRQIHSREPPLSTFAHTPYAAIKGGYIGWGARCDCLHHPFTLVAELPEKFMQINLAGKTNDDSVSRRTEFRYVVSSTIFYPSNG